MEHPSSHPRNYLLAEDSGEVSFSVPQKAFLFIEDSWGSQVIFLSSTNSQPLWWANVSPEPQLSVCTWWFTGGHPVHFSALCNHHHLQEFNLKLDWDSFPMLLCAQVLEQPNLTGPTSTWWSPDAPSNPNISMAAARAALAALGTQSCSSTPSESDICKQQSMQTGLSMGFSSWSLHHVYVWTSWVILYQWSRQFSQIVLLKFV